MDISCSSGREIEAVSHFALLPWRERGRMQLIAFVPVTVEALAAVREIAKRRRQTSFAI